MKLNYFLTFVILIVFGISGINQSLANCLIFCDDVEKAYVSSDQIFIDYQGIFVSVEGETIQVQAILQDNEGLYYLKPTIYWTCKKCKYTKNPAWTNKCRGCGKRYNE